MIAALKIADVQQQVIQQLQNALPTITVRDGLLFEQLFGQLEHPLITVVLKKMGASDVGFSDYCGMIAGQAESSELYAKHCDLAFSIQVFLPLGGEVPAPSDLLLAIGDALLLDPTGSFFELASQPIKFDERIQAFVLELTATTALLLTRGEDVPLIRQVDLRAGNIRN